jgi:hypothetical protein
MASVALDGTRLGTADGLTRPGTWRVSPVYASQQFFSLYSVMLSFLPIHGYFDPFIFIFRQRDRVITPSFARP